MVVTNEHLEAFHRFATKILAESERDLSWDELLILWGSNNNRSAANSAIREGIADIDAGRFQRGDEVLEDLRQFRL